MVRCWRAFSTCHEQLKHEANGRLMVAFESALSCNRPAAVRQNLWIQSLRDLAGKDWPNRWRQ